MILKSESQRVECLKLLKVLAKWQAEHGVAGWRRHPEIVTVLLGPDDPWGRPIQLRMVEDVLAFRSLGPDGRWGTEDDITHEVVWNTKPNGK